MVTDGYAGAAVKIWHLVTPEYPPLLGGVSEHSRVLADAAAQRGREVHVWTRNGAFPAPHVDVHTALGAFSPADLARTDADLDRFPGPREILVQWVPHGFGYRGMNVHFPRWVASRAAKGDRVDVIVHEPFVDYFGGSLTQPARAIVQRYMTRMVLRRARRVWMSIPGWEARLAPMLPDPLSARVLPISGTVPIDCSPEAVAHVRQHLAANARFLVGSFGTAGAYGEAALLHTIRTSLGRRTDLAFVCIGRGSEELARRLQADLPAHAQAILATGVLDSPVLSHHLSACDMLVQPYVDGVSGRRTTTITGLEHGVPVATTHGMLSEPFWENTEAVVTVPAAAPQQMADAVDILLTPERNTRARSAALALYSAHFAPDVVLELLFRD